MAAWRCRPPRSPADNNLAALSSVPSTGKDGKILKRRCWALSRPAPSHCHLRQVFSASHALSSGQATLPAVATPVKRQPGRPPGSSAMPMSRLRARVAERLLQSQTANAILHHLQRGQTGPGDGDTQTVRRKVRKTHGVLRSGFMSFFVKTAVAQQVPGAQRLGGRNDIVYPRLSTSVSPSVRRAAWWCRSLRNADQMSIATSRRRSPSSAKTGTANLGIEERGGTFSISNGGVFGSMLTSTPSSTRPSRRSSASTPKDRAVVENGQVVVRPINYLAMSYDHRSSTAARPCWVWWR